MCTRVGTLIVATMYLQLIQNRYMFRNPATRAEYMILSLLQYRLILRIYIHVSVCRKFRCVNFLLSFPWLLTWHSVPALGTGFLHLALSSYTWRSGPTLGTQFLQMALSSCTYKSISLQTLNCTAVNCFTFSFNQNPSH